MPTHVNEAKAQEILADLIDRVVKNNEVVLITRQTGEDVALVSVSELTSLMETVYLLRSPRNAKRLLNALNQALKHQRFIPRTRLL